MVTPSVRHRWPLTPTGSFLVGLQLLLVSAVVFAADERWTYEGDTSDTSSVARSPTPAKTVAVDAMDFGFTGYSNNDDGVIPPMPDHTSVDEPSPNSRGHNKKQFSRRGQRQRNNKNALRLLVGMVKLNSGGAGAWPQIVNAATKATIVANATCGRAGREEYCRMIDAHPQRTRAPQCGWCDDSGELTERHGIQNAIDGSGRWWQSPSLIGGKHFEYVTITLDLKQVYQVVFILIKTAISPRPASWTLERSLDGVNYSPWQHFGASDADCQQRFNLPGQSGIYTFSRDDEVICSTRLSKLTPLENGEMQLSLISNRPGLNTSSPELTQFTLARHVRIRLQSMHTTMNYVQWLADLPALDMRSFYTIRHIKIGARVMCSGHATKTHPVSVLMGERSDGEEGESATVEECSCLHNTCGLSCEKCCPMFNQRPFRMATMVDVNPCEKCQCHNHATECYYNPEVDAKRMSVNMQGEMSGGGVCLNCTDFTTGINCEECQINYYRPDGVLPDAKTPCVPCECSSVGATGPCDPVGGRCVCREGFTGVRCDQCATGYTGDNCSKCDCDVRGTMPGGECESFCQCKLHVEGPNCDRCLPGYFALRDDNPEGCLKCYCSGVAHSCESSDLQLSVHETVEQWSVTDISRTVFALPTRDNETGHLVFGLSELPKVNSLFWSAPHSYLGNLLTSYGSSFDVHIAWVTVRGDTSGTTTTGPSVILWGSNGMKIAIGEETYTTQTKAVIRITMDEDGWYHVPDTPKDSATRLRRTDYHGDPVTRVQFMSVLSDVESILIRGSFHTDQVESVFVSASLYSGEVVTTTNQRVILSQVEQCHCPPGYVGRSCETCAFGYARVYENNTAHERVAKCHQCDCNGHAAECDVLVDVCGTCEHNTYGERCERCAVGYYGNAMHGTAEDCQRCACPLSVDSNNFSPGCQLKELRMDMNQLSNELSVGGNYSADYVCTQCPTGYTGDHCEICDDGFYGSPTTIGSSCLPCPCNGGPCDPSTGRCISCLGNTEGWRCERCKAGYWGDAERGCEKCRCHDVGALSHVCDGLTGQCVCIERYTGHHCDECDIGFGNVTLDCPDCDCNMDGATERFCDTETGQCPCKLGVEGIKCDDCQDEYFGLTSDGCEECHCNPHGSIGRSCNRHTGQCQCLPNVTGRACDQCAPGFRHLEAGKGCTACSCDPVGSRNDVCNPHTGQCSCHTGVGGVACDRCQDDHYGYSARGCKRCDECANSAYVCDEQTGRCICPPLSRGPDCQQCVPNTWGWVHRRGCQECDCGHHGTIEQKCDLYTGDCQCRQGFDGRRCDRCATGYFGYPKCQPCHCNANGAIPSLNGTLIQCDDRGQCPCKSLVTGLKCDMCRQSTFGLAERNEAGCLRCFCFGRSQTCRQSDMTWGQIRSHGSRNLSVDYLADGDEEYVVVVQMKGRDTEYNDAEIERKFDLHLIPSVIGNVSIGSRHEFRVPLYFQLPAQYAGDLLASYGGWLNYSILIDGATRTVDEIALRTHPLVQLHSHTNLVLEYFGPQIEETSENITYTVGINETYWRYRFTDQNVTRAIMLTALQNVKYLLVRATTWTDFGQVIISNVTMDSGYYVSGSKSNMARSVEVCECPDQYNGTSCQDPAKGYYRWKNPEQIGSEKLLIDFVGESRPCECNGRSDVCDRDTGDCMACRDNTGGASCETCAEGYYGDPNYGDGCEACPCPETNRNFARGCAVRNRKVMCICKTGYTGALCDSCAMGFYGQPNGLAGKCQSCECDPDGIVSDECDELTGQCNCRPGLTGRRCDRCDQSRSMLQDGQCRACDNCTQTLLDRTDELSLTLQQGSGHLDPNGIPAPWLKLLDYDNRTDILTEEVSNAINIVYSVHNFDDETIEKLLSRALALNKREFKLSERADKRYHRADHLNTELSLVHDEALQSRASIEATITALNHYTHNDKVDLAASLNEAHAILNSIHPMDFQQTSVEQQTLKCARDHFDEWSYIYQTLSDQQDEVESLKYNTSLLRTRINDASILAEISRSKTDEALSRLHASHADYEQLLLDEELARKYKDEINEALNNSFDAQMNVLDAQYHDNAQKIRQDIKNIGEMKGLVQEANGHCAQGLQEIRHHWLPRATEHQEGLTQAAEQYAKLFENTKDGAAVALRASSAHRSIVEAIESARKSSADALEAVSQSRAELFDDTDSATVIKRGQSSVLASKSIEAAASEEFKKLDDLNETLDGHKKAVADIGTIIWQTGLQNNDMSTKLNGINNDATRKVVTDRMDMAVKVSDQMRKVHREATDISSDVYKLKLKLNALEPQWDTQFGGAQENISQTEGNIQIATKTLNRLEDIQANTTKHFERWNSSMSSSLQELRDKISKARHAAESIRVSIQSNTTNCIRSYVPTVLGLTTANTIKMSIAVSKPDGPLLFIQGDGRTFLALEMVKRRIHFVWNLGGDTGSITHPTELRARELKYNDAWYQIEVNRTMNLASVSIGQMDNQGTLTTKRSVNGATKPDYTRLLLTAASRIWLGGVPVDSRPAELLKSELALGVVVHKIQVDDQPIGLWNFAHSQGTCNGAMVGAHETNAGSGTWHFNGLGYATVKKSRTMVSKNRFAMQLIFKTFDENALLFLAVDVNNNRSISLTLHEGRLIFRIDYGNESKLEINTTNRYNYGNWTKVEVARHFASGTENGLLTIPSSEEKSGSPNHPITSKNLPNLSKAVYYLGGVPPGFKSGTTKAPGADHAYLGCMKDIQVNGDSYDPLDSSAHFGVEAQCRDIINIAGFHGNGYVELPAHSLRKRANIGLVMRTLQSECLVLLAHSADTASNYSLSLVGGRPHVWLYTAASNPVRMSANVSLNDGEYHVVGVQKTGCRVELRIDDRLQDTARFDSHGCAVNMAVGGRLFLGGAPDDFEKYDELAASFDRFTGAIKDVVFNNETVYFNEQLNFNRVQLGRSGPIMGQQAISHASQVDPIATSFAAVPEGCHRVGSYSYEPDAFKFGDVLHSHSIVGLSARQLWQKNFNILFDFRTFYPNGVLFLAPGTKEKQKHFIGLILREGKLTLIMRGRKKEEHTVPMVVNDGQWHHVSLVSIKKTLTIRVEVAAGADQGGDSVRPVVSVIQLPKRINAANTMFIGGISETAGGSLPGELFTKLEQFKGCIRRFRINNTTQDLARPGRHFNVGQCFPSVEKGSYFPGDAYVVYKKNFHVGNYMELQFEFRTSELNGVLLSVSEPNGFPALSIEIFGGKIVMSCDLGDGNPFRVDTSSVPLSKFSLCDNRWHNISAMYDSEQLTLRIDSHPWMLATAPTRAGGKVNTKSPLYIGGLADTAPSGTLLSRDNFKGCIRNVLIRNELRDWTDMDELHNVLLSECLAIH